jgi:hypothetical protein
MTWPVRWCAPVGAIALASLTVVRAASAETRRVAAIDADAELARALDIALLPWGTAIAEVHVGGAAPMTVEHARSIAEETHADVVMWVSKSDARYAVWIYDVTSDHASLRELTTAPPFDATTAAAVALSVKALLRFTVVAPPPERFGAVVEEPTWVFGLSASAADHLGAAPELVDQTDRLETRGGVYGSFWPAYLDHRWGLSLGVSGGLGIQVSSNDNMGPTFVGTLTDLAVRAAIGARVPIRPWLAIEPSIGAALHFVRLDAIIKEGMLPTAYPSVERVDGAFEPQVALSFALLGGLFRLAPWVGATLLTAWQHFHLFADRHIELTVSPVTAEAGLRAEFGLP